MLGDLDRLQVRPRTRDRNALCLTTTSSYLTMGTTGYFLASDHNPASDKRAARVRRMLLEQVRFAITTEPAAVEYQADTAPGSLTNIRGRVSITLGTIVVRLNQEGFAHSD